MVLTYSMVLGRLDTLNQRERQVRRFYEPLPSFNKERPYPHRHRFADVLEPGDVVRTIDKGEDGGWEEGIDNIAGNGGGDGSAQQATGNADGLSRARTAAEEQEQINAMRENRTLGPGRDSQKLVSLASKKERQLRKAIDSELSVRRETLKSRLYSEAGVAMEGEEYPKASEQDKIDPLFKVGKAQMMFPKPAVHKTGEVSGPLATVELKLGESGPRLTASALYKPKPNAGGQEDEFTPAAREQEQTDAEQVHEDHTGDIPRTASAMSSVSARSGLQRVNSSGMNSTQDGMFGTQDALQEDEEWSAEYSGEDDADIFQGPVSTWAYRKSVYSEHDDPQCREFYYTQLSLPPEELEEDSAERTYVVKIEGMSFDHQPEHTCIAAGRNEDGKLLFQRAGDDEQRLSTILSTADELPWITVPIQLKSHQLRLAIYRRRNSAEDCSGDVFVSERVVNFRAPYNVPIAAYPEPPTSAPEAMATRSHGRQSLVLQPGAAAARPGTAPAVSPSKEAGRGTPSPGKRSPQGVSPAARWSSWAENGGAEAGGVPNLLLRELSQENKSFEESPAARKKKELARMRQQMRASLQQTQSQVLASMGGAGAGSSADPKAARNSASGAQLSAPMQIVSRPGTSSSPTSSRPGSQSSVRFR